MTFSQNYLKLNQQKNSKISVGLDPNLARIPKFILTDISDNHDETLIGQAIFNFNKYIIDCIHDLVPVVKPQLAYFEQFGWPGIKAYYDTIEYAHEKDLLVIADAKRGDIGATSSAYASGFLNSTTHENVDAMTVNPYLGPDTLDEFFKTVKATGNGIFVLVKTSNPGSKDLQSLQTSNENKDSNSEIVSTWLNHEIQSNHEDLDNDYSDIGAVVGATYPEEMTTFRNLLKNSLFLVPGIGAQGGDISEIYRAFDKNKQGAIINSSRAILYPSTVDINTEKTQYTQAVRQAVLNLNTAINQNLNQHYDQAEN
ncbi:orotidine-5'-phosphate decarboxylase [Weissella minor]|uniref:orotidine-5'-phosphate decarboxylase n=1 Tax=Weissella minor TaxID=1620 RepID=UPI001BAF0B33|nr:orotidine-5'-phosphate decarboxylase [Weissella minor]MBS0949619.1 orotidine-5'-phosphate decarboxylase [Weissella minor]